MFLRFLIPLLFLALRSRLLSAKVVPLIQPGFFFDYNKQGEPVPIPITNQCERIHLEWGRNGAIGENPTAPYFLQVFTSTAITPFIIPAGSGLSFDWDVPFAPGTQVSQVLPSLNNKRCSNNIVPTGQYQICMFDINGVPGGCQAMYTMVQNSTTTKPVCQNVTAPPQLDIEGQVAGGPISQYGFINQCTDISITPKNGTPPYILTVSPPLHPPYNITSNNMDPIVWTVSLSWSYPFFISLVSSDGQMWANGPMHAGGFGPDDCLAPGSISRKKATDIAVGSSFGTLFGAALLGFVGLRVFTSLRQREFKIPNLEIGWSKKLTESVATTTSTRIFDRPLPDIPRRLQESTEWEPNTPPPVLRPQRFHPTEDATAFDRSTRQARTRTVIVHFDGGRVRPRSQESDEVIELPPEYRRHSISSVSEISSDALTRSYVPRRVGKRNRSH